MKRKPKLSRLAIQALRDAGIESSWTEAGGPGDFSSDLFSWIEEQNIINRAIAASLRRGRGANKKADALAIWQEFKRRRPSYVGSDTKLTVEIGREYGLKKSAAIEARKRGKKLASSTSSAGSSAGYCIRALDPRTGKKSLGS